MKKIISIALAVLMIALAVPAFTVMAAAAETTSGVPVATEAEIAAISNGKITVSGKEYTVVNGTNIYEALENNKDGAFYLVEPITLSKSLVGGFTGQFNGGNNTITLGSGVTFVFGSGNFGDSDTVVANITIANDGSTVSYNWWGATLTTGRVAGGYYYNITNTVNIESKGYAGALISALIDNPQEDLHVTFEKCVNAGAVKCGDMLVGGILGSVGNNNNGVNITVTFIDCENSGAIDGNGKSYIGGIFGGNHVIADGKFKAEFIGCKNTADITGGANNVGAICGGMQISGSVVVFENCKNSGNITATAENASIGLFGGNKDGVDSSVSYTNCSNVMPCANHTYVSGVCSVCGAADPTATPPAPPAGGDTPTPPPVVTPPVTSDVTVFVLAIAVVALAGVCVAKKKIKE